MDIGPCVDMGARAFSAVSPRHRREFFGTQARDAGPRLQGVIDTLIVVVAVSTALMTFDSVSSMASAFRLPGAAGLIVVFAARHCSAI